MQQVEARGPTQAQDPLGMGTPRPLRGVTPGELIIPHDIAYLCLQVGTSKGLSVFVKGRKKTQRSCHKGWISGAIMIELWLCLCNLNTL